MWLVLNNHIEQCSKIWEGRKLFVQRKLILPLHHRSLHSDFLLPFTHNFYLTSGHFLHIGSFKYTSLGTGPAVSPLNWVDFWVTLSCALLICLLIFKEQKPTCTAIRGDPVLSIIYSLRPIWYTKIWEKIARKQSKWRKEPEKVKLTRKVQVLGCLDTSEQTENTRVWFGLSLWEGELWKDLSEHLVNKNNHIGAEGYGVGWRSVFCPVLSTAYRPLPSAFLGLSIPRWWNT